MKAAIVGDNIEASIQDVPLPQFNADSDQLFIRVHCASQNPSDWKAHVMVRSPPGIAGSDIAGVVEKVGIKASDRFKVGDRVAAMLLNGGFAEYAVSKAHVTFKIPDSVSFEEASTVPLAGMTAFFAVFRWLNFPVDDVLKTAQITNKVPVVIYGASSSVGIFAIQFAKLANLRVIAVAGKSLSYAEAFLDVDDVAIDYRLPNLVQRVREAAGEPLFHAIDVISDANTLETVAKILAPGGKLSCIFPAPPQFNPPSITVIPYVAVHTCYGEDLRFEMKEGDPIIIRNNAEDVKFGQNGFELFAQWLKAGKLKGAKVREMGRLESVGEGLLKMRNGEVSGEKLVYKIY